jgi:hypothetical protein
MLAYFFNVVRQVKLQFAFQIFTLNAYLFLFEKAEFNFCSFGTPVLKLVGDDVEC